MLTYTFDTSKKITLTKQLYEGIKNDILRGAIKQGEKLPSKRSLSAHLRISIVTVENAYSQLAAEGYIVSRERSGYFVHSVEEMLVPVQGEVGSVKTETTLEEAPGDDIFMDFRTNRICEENFPCSTLSRIMRQVLTEKLGLLQPLEFCGVRELREAIADHLYRYREISVSPDQIIIGAGTEYLYHLLIQLLGRDKIYAVETPGYSKTARIYELNGVGYEHIPVDRSGMSLEILKKTEAEIIHISPSHHFPTGIVMPIRRRQELLKWAKENDDRYIIEDDYDSEFRFLGHPIPPFYSLDSEKVIYINTFSKSITPAVRISYMVLPHKLMERYRSRMGFYSCTVSGIDQYMLARFIREGYFERHINRMKTLYRTKRDAVIDAIRKSAFSDDVFILEENAGLHFLMRINTDISDRELKRCAESEGLRVAFLTEYMQNPSEEYEHIMVINYSGAEDEKLSEAMRRLEKILGY